MATALPGARQADEEVQLLGDLKTEGVLTSNRLSSELAVPNAWNNGMCVLLSISFTGI